MINYCIIGDNWGNKILKILKDRKKNVFLFKSKHPKSSKKYFFALQKYLNLNNINFVWIATPPKNRIKLITNCIKFNQNLIIEKPVIFTEKQILSLTKKLRQKKKLLFVNFEYIFLNKLNNYRYRNIVKLRMDFHHISKNKHKINPYLNNGTHLASIKEKFFKNCNKFEFFVSEGKKNLRSIQIFTKYRIHKINFTYNAEPIIQKFVNYVEDVYKKKEKNYLNLKFGFKCTRLIKNYLKKKS